MATQKRRAKHEPTKGDVLAQQYRNRAAMFRIHQAALNKKNGITLLNYWEPTNIDTLTDIKWG